MSKTKKVRSYFSDVNNQRRNVLNDKPVIGPYHVNITGSNDMYYKGSLMLQLLHVCQLLKMSFFS